ncbi:MAG TPA: hypothetical protein VML95_00180 [Longimicrobiales bacterium]|nr:hypothetical protein [Longimicrobiales bacterium]
MRRNAVMDWLRFGTITGLVFGAGAGASAWHFGVPGPQVGAAAAAGFAFGATIEWISLRFRTPATAFAVILTVAFVGTLQAYAPRHDEVGITQDFRALSATLMDPDTAGEGALSGASVRRNVEHAEELAAERAGPGAVEASVDAGSPLRELKRKGARRTGGVGAP